MTIITFLPATTGTVKRGYINLGIRDSNGIYKVFFEYYAMRQETQDASSRIDFFLNPGSIPFERVISYYPNSSVGYDYGHHPYFCPWSNSYIESNIQNIAALALTTDSGVTFLDGTKIKIIGYTFN